MEPDYFSMDEDDSYIEIKIDASPLSLPSSTDDNKDHEYHHHQLRISISSTISLPLQKDDEEDEDEDDHDKYPCIPPLINFNDDDTIINNNDKSNTTILFNNTPVGVGLIMENNNYAHKSEAQTTVQGRTHHMDAPCSRRLPNMTTTKNGGMMKLLIKVRGINIGATLASLIKPLYQHNTKNGHNKTKSSSSSKKYFQCYQKNLVNPTNTRRSNNNNNNWEFEDEIMCGSFRSCKKSSTKLEMDLGAIRGIFNAMGMNIIANNKKGSSKSKRRSQPNSCDTTPIHEGFSSYTNNNNNNDNNNNISIQAAIAYCKSSFNQTSNFSF